MVVICKQIYALNLRHKIFSCMGGKDLEKNIDHRSTGANRLRINRRNAKNLRFGKCSGQ